MPSSQICELSRWIQSQHLCGDGQSITWSSWWVCILMQIPIKQQDIPTQVTSTDEPESQKHWGVIRIWAGPPALGRLRKCPWFCWSWTYKGMWLGDSLPLAGSLNGLPTGVLRSNCLFDWVGIPLRAKSRKPTWWDNSLKLSLYSGFSRLQGVLAPPVHAHLELAWELTSTLVGEGLEGQLPSAH